MNRPTRESSVSVPSMINCTRRGLCWFASSCPYTRLGLAASRWAARRVRGSTSGAEVANSSLGAWYRTGRSLVAVGLMCPFFWVAFLTGANPSIVRINALHSGLMILLGFAAMAMSKLCAEWNRNRKK